MSLNCFSFLCSTLEQFEQLGLKLWVFGGWAEELWQITPPRPHKDIDLLYPAASFATLDCLIGSEKQFSEIVLKRFSHKRALLYQGIMLEFLLVEGHGAKLTSSFFDRRYQFHWPADTFDYTLSAAGRTLAVASPRALRLYRHRHQAIEQAYTAALHSPRP